VAAVVITMIVTTIAVVEDTVVAMTMAEAIEAPAMIDSMTAALDAATVMTTALVVLIAMHHPEMIATAAVARSDVEDIMIALDLVQPEALVEQATPTLLTRTVVTPMAVAGLMMTVVTNDTLVDEVL
jgi:hypothetical protein